MGLQIQGIKRYQEIIDIVKNDEPEEAYKTLVQMIRYLDNYACGTEDTIDCLDNCRVTIYPDHKDLYFGIVWEFRFHKDGEEDKFIRSMNGGLVYFKDSHTWSIHT